MSMLHPRCPICGPLDACVPGPLLGFMATLARLEETLGCPYCGEPASAHGLAHPHRRGRYGECAGMVRGEEASG